MRRQGINPHIACKELIGQRLIYNINIQSLKVEFQTPDLIILVAELLI